MNANSPNQSSESRAIVNAAGTWSDGQPTVFPTRLGRYELRKLLGRGGMGAVYLAWDTILDRAVALKLPNAHLISSPAMRERFLREARAAGNLNHANICPVHDAGVIDGIYYMAMAYVEGEPLSKLLHRGQPLPVRQTVVWVRQLALAMQEAHDRGIIHRDLKPGNVIINAKKQPVIMDFGLARRNEPGDERLTVEGVILGTPAYMPPEQVNGAADGMGPWSDIYSLGVILYECLTGRLPFQGPLAAIMAQVLLDPPPPPSQFRADLDPRLEALCLQALAKASKQRHGSMKEFAASLMEWLRSTSDRTAQATPPPQQAVETRAPSARQTRAIKPRRQVNKMTAGVQAIAAALAGLCVVFGCAALLIWFTRSAAKEPDVQALRNTSTTAATNVPIRPTHKEPDHPPPATKADADSEKSVQPAQPPPEPPPPATPTKPPPSDADKIAASLSASRGHLKAKRYQEAVSACEDALRVKERNPEALVLRAMAWLGLGKLVEAEQDATRALQIDPQYADAMACRAEIHLEKGEWRAALGDADAALTRKPSEPSRAQAFRGIAKAQLGCDNDAITDLNDALKSAPDVPAFLWYRGLVADRLGSPNQAKTDKDRALQLEPELMARAPRLVDRPRTFPNNELAGGKIPAPDLSAAKRLYHDDFHDRATNFPHGAYKEWCWHGYEKNTYVIRHQAGNFSSQWGLGEWRLTDVACRVVGRPSNTPTAWGIELEQPDNKNCIFVYLDGMGQVAVVWGGKDADKRPPLWVGAHNAIKRGTQPNTLMVVRTGRQLEVYVNDVAVMQPLQIEEELCPSWVWLACKTTGQGGAAEFHEVSVWGADGMVRRWTGKK